MSKLLLVMLAPTVIILGLAAGQQKTDQKLDNGKAVFDKTCSVCHTYGPPPKTAPPMVGISQHYHENFKDTDTEKGRRSHGGLRQEPFQGEINAPSNWS